VRRALAALALAACSPPVRGEVVLVVDTDAEVPRLVDSLRVEVFSQPSLTLLEARDITLATPDQWPTSFGLAAAALDGAPGFRVRLTAYRAAWRLDDLEGETPAAVVAEPHCPDGAVDPIPPALALDGARVLPQHAIGRLLDVAAVEGEVVERRVLLDSACLGAAPPQLGDTATCVGGVPGATDVFADAREGTSAGTSPLLAPGACESDATRACIPGGLYYLGGPHESDNGACPACSTLPAVPIRVEPFLLDRTEVTVGRFEEALAAGFDPPALPGSKEGDSPCDTDALCTWGAGAADGPLNCVEMELADAFCAWAGGALPSEAQWVYAATGRGLGWRYPWGPEPRPAAEVGINALVCYVSPPILIDAIAAVGSHPADASPEGVMDLFGSVAELVADVPGALARRGCRVPAAVGLEPRAYVGPVANDAACACAGQFHDPEYESPEARLGARVVRGASFGDAVAVDRRQVYAPAPPIGFRCAYEVVP
jgi:formylglycine-generating enzyme required for sulfatase activity